MIIVGYSASPKKDAELIYEAFMSTNINLTKVKIFHTDRGNEFKNKIIDEVLQAFKIKRSLSKNDRIKIVQKSVDNPHFAYLQQLNTYLTLKPPPCRVIKLLSVFFVKDLLQMQLGFVLLVSEAYQH